MSDKYIPACRDGVTPLKRVAAIHDLSCFGRCALTVIIPTLSAMGVQVVPVPTCLLSSHTGGFKYSELHFEDLSHSIEGISEHFHKLDLKFDAIYTGFLGSAGQIDSVKAFIERFGEDGTTVLVDPVMGDDGRLYSTYTDELMQRMSELCHGAHIITPNLTEACFLTGTKYMDTKSMSRDELTEYAHGLCLSLSHTGADKIVITGLESADGELCVCGMDADNGGFFLYAFNRVDKSYPGTGDLFASVLLGGLLRGDDFESSIHFAADFTARVMEYSSHFCTPEREGVALEAFIGELAVRKEN